MTEGVSVSAMRSSEAARRQVAVAANAALTTLYWQLGHRVLTEVLQSRRAEYGAQIVAAVGRQLEARHGRGFGEKNLRRMVQFAEVFSSAEIVAALLRQLGWTHFTLLIPIKEPLKRDFYAEMCRIEGPRHDGQHGRPRYYRASRRPLSTTIYVIIATTWLAISLELAN